MNFKEFLNTVKYEINYLEGEINYETISDAWRAGASAMVERLLDYRFIDMDCEASIRGALKEFTEDKE